MSRESSLSNAEIKTNGGAEEEPIKPFQVGPESEKIEDQKPVKNGSDERRSSADKLVEPDPSKHQEELTERLEQISNTLKEHVQQ